MYPTPLRVWLQQQILLTQDEEKPAYAGFVYVAATKVVRHFISFQFQFLVIWHD